MPFFSFFLLGGSGVLCLLVHVEGLILHVASACNLIFVFFFSETRSSKAAETRSSKAAAAASQKGNCQKPRLKNRRKHNQFLLRHY
jgi:hypothetical protein